MSAAHAELARALGGEPEGLAPLSGGAGRCEMWAATVAGRPVVYRRYPEGPERDVVREREWRVLQLARDAGVPVAEPLALTPEGIVVERVAGESRPRPLLNDERWARARSVLVARVAEAAARLHAIEPPPDLPAEPEFEGGAAAADLAGLSLRRGRRRGARALPRPASASRTPRSSSACAGCACACRRPPPAVDRPRRLPALEPGRRRGRPARR